MDLIVTGPLDKLVERSEPLVILAGANAANPCPFNGSVILFTAGTNCDLWEGLLDFNVIKIIPRYEFPDDQGWIHYKRPDAATWNRAESGIYASKARLASGARSAGRWHHRFPARIGAVHICRGSANIGSVHD